MLISCFFFFFFLQHSISLYSQNWIRCFQPHSIFFLNHEDNKLSSLLAVIIDVNIWHSIHTKYNKWNQYVINFFSQAKIHKFSKIYILYIPFIYMYVCKSFSTMLDTGLRRNNSKKKREIGKHKLNEMVK